MRTLIHFKAKIRVLNENDNVACFIAINIAKGVFFLSQSDWSICGCASQGRCRKTTFRGSEWEASSLHILLLSQMLNSLKYD